jgi:transposase
MTPVRYDEMRRVSKDPKVIRYRLVRYATEHGVKPAARAFDTTPKTVRKWLARWEHGTMQGLSDQSRAPKRPKTYITEQQRQQVIELKRMLPSFGACRIKENFGLSLSEKAIRRIWKQEGLMRRKRKKHKTKQNLRAIKAQWKLFEQTSIDTKDLDDIPELWPQIKALGLPKVQYTAREVTSGMMFIAYANERSLIYADLFAKRLIQHLRCCGIDLRDCRFQTDNGSEFIGAWNAKDDSIFTKSVTCVQGLQHTTIPPGAHTWQADVETVHRIIEDEFYEVESFTSRNDFLRKATTYCLWFNVARKNSYKENQTPWEIAFKKNPNINPQLPVLTPVFLDELYFHKTNDYTKGGYHVVPHP